MATDEDLAARQADLDRLLADNELDRREFCRVFPSANDPVFLEIEGQTLNLRDLSGGGLSFLGETTLFSGWIYPAKLTLPGREEPLAVKVLVISLDPDGLIRGRFQDLKPQAADVINSYVQKRQQELLALAEENLSS